MSVPVYTEDLYEEDAILEPYPHYERLRALGPVVWLEAHQVYALPRYAEVRAVLGDDERFRTEDGVSLNQHYNDLIRGSTFASDGERHRFLRGLVAHDLTPRALRPLSADVQAVAARVVERAVAAGEFDAVNGLARDMVMEIVPDFLGIPADGREHLIDWAAANFNCHGPLNGRAEEALAVSGRMAAYAARMVDARTARPGGLAHSVLRAMDDGRVDRDQAVSLMIDYLVPSLDTTVTGLAAAIWLFARHPEQWDLVRADPALVGAAFNEAVRLETPVRQFGRRAVTGVEIAGVPIPAGSQVLVMFASANRDERKWERPTEFDVRRNPVDHVGFGYGAHGCAGQGLARLEAHAVLTELAGRVRRFEVSGERRTVNNLMRAFDTLPTRVTV
ncbi:cytochrome P450 [Actinomadura sp. KC216]|uniref:cytochrome P450 n=1 Tax=Actinomadura sp. KC216 TaxID=2530370 RepID=UPI0010443BAE|nr:cytochrome P450 [Actinomadura sp. KC216]TDB91936.1 cytochrome P450 [Actinomadura sp. KC216]